MINTTAVLLKRNVLASAGTSGGPGGPVPLNKIWPPAKGPAHHKRFTIEVVINWFDRVRMSGARQRSNRHHNSVIKCIVYLIIIRRLEEEQQQHRQLYSLLKKIACMLQLQA